MDLERRTVGHVDRGAGIHVDRVARPGRAAIDSEHDFGAVGHIHRSGQRQHQPRGGADLGVPLHLDAVEREHAARIVQAEAHPALAVAGQLLVDGNLVAAGERQRLVEALRQLAILQQDNGRSFFRFLYSLIKRLVLHITDLCYDVGCLRKSFRGFGDGRHLLRRYGRGSYVFRFDGDS